MKMMKKLSCMFAVVLVICMMLSASAFAVTEVTYSTKSAGSVQDQAMDLFAQKLEELSGGRIVGKKYIAGTIGSEEEMAEAVAMGDLGATFAADTMIGNCANGVLGFLALPGLVKSYDDAEAAIYSEDGWLSQIISQIMEEKIGLKRLAGGDNDFRVLGVNKEIKTKADIQGVKVRCGNAWANLEFYGRAGFMPVVVASSETMSALEQGTVDGAENGLVNLRDGGYATALKYILPVNYMYSPASIIVNLDWFDSLSAEDQAIVTEAAKIAARFEIDANIKASEDLMEEMTGNGTWTKLEMNDELVSAFDAAVESMWKDAPEKYGADVIDLLLANMPQD
ncbi:MAG: TRAP transporter substrate-binding protein [Oscillospiraceae bacterium]|nr:TRAP transporter substrate-binding protein [Oscillospiraceae bacterium]